MTLTAAQSLRLWTWIGVQNHSYTEAAALLTTLGVHATPSQIASWFGLASAAFAEARAAALRTERELFVANIIKLTTTP